MTLMLLEQGHLWPTSVLTVWTLMYKEHRKSSQALCPPPVHRDPTGNTSSCSAGGVKDKGIQREDEPGCNGCSGVTQTAQE